MRSPEVSCHVTRRKSAAAAFALIGLLALGGLLSTFDASTASAASSKGHATFVRSANAICTEANEHTSGAEIPGDPGEVTADEVAAWGQYMDQLQTAGTRAQSQFAALKVPTADAKKVRKMLDALDAYVHDMQRVTQVATQNDVAAMQIALGSTYNDEVAFKNASAALGLTKCAA
jgi:hypothetical protein